MKYKAKLQQLASELKNAAYRVGPAHPWWDIAFDIEAFLQGKQTLLQKSEEEWIKYAEDTLNARKDLVAMAMRENGLAKLIEETGELQQIAGKMIQYPHLQHSTTELHPSGYLLRQRFLEEAADTLAAMMFVCDKLDIDKLELAIKQAKKLALFKRWDAC